MALLRAWFKVRTHCPVCDAPLEPSLAHAEAPQCPACEHRLIPVIASRAWRRALAGGVDFIVLLLTAGALNLLLLRWFGASPLWGGASGLGALLHLFEVSAGTWLLRGLPFLGMSAVYFGLFWSTTGRTPGARLLGIRVIDRFGRPPHLSWTAVRVVSHFVGATIGLLGWWWAVFDLERRAWHDHFARTYVVKDA